MPYRVLVAKEMSELLAVLAHPARIRIIEELQSGEKDVTTLQKILGINRPGVSQTLSLMRAHKIVIERREGRNVFYRLRQPNLASWLVQGLQFLAVDFDNAEKLSEAIDKTRAAWLSDTVQSG